MPTRSPAFRSSILLLAAVSLLALLPPFVPAARAQGCQASCAGLPGGGQVSPAYRSYDDFIVLAYLGALGRYPSCFERQAEYYNLAYSGGGGALLAEAKRFVATLFMTQPSYDVPDLLTYRQTNAYQARNAEEGVTRASLQSFVADLYRTYLQREPDQAGLCFWTNNVCVEGRKKGTVAFQASPEFGDLVSRLFDGGLPCYYYYY